MQKIIINFHVYLQIELQIRKVKSIFKFKLGSSLFNSISNIIGNIKNVTSKEILTPQTHHPSKV